jgi:acetyl esterase/lipase
MYAPLHGLPPALFTVGTADHLLDDTLFMSRRWEAWGNEVELAVYPDCPHAFLGQPTELAKRAAARIDAFIARHTSPEGSSA